MAIDLDTVLDEIRKIERKELSFRCSKRFKIVYNLRDIKNGDDLVVEKGRIYKFLGSVFGVSIVEEKVDGVKHEIVRLNSEDISTASYSYTMSDFSNVQKGFRVLPPNTFRIIPQERLQIYKITQ